MTSAKEHPDIVSSYVAEECKQGRVLGPFPPGELQNIHINRFGVIPKHHQPNRWRLIVDLSYPDGASVKNGVSKELCSLQYIKIDNVAEAAIYNMAEEKSWTKLMSKCIQGGAGTPK